MMQTLMRLPGSTVLLFVSSLHIPKMIVLFSLVFLKTYELHARHCTPLMDDSLHSVSSLSPGGVHCIVTGTYIWMNHVLGMKQFPSPVVSNLWHQGQFCGKTIFPWWRGWGWFCDDPSSSYLGFMLPWESNVATDLTEGRAQVVMWATASGWKYRWSFLHWPACCSPPCCAALLLMVAIDQCWSEGWGPCFNRCEKSAMKTKESWS